LLSLKTKTTLITNGMIGILALDNSTRRNRLTEVKDKQYHLDMGKFFSHMSYSDQRRAQFIRNAAINWCFYKGKQWIFDQDLDGFFLDDAGSFTNRIKVVKNMIQPMVKQYEGTAIRTSYRSKVRSIDDAIITRKEEELRRRLSFAKAAKALPNLRETIKGRVPIGENDFETKEEFERTFIDVYEESMNYLLEYMSKKNNFKKIYRKCSVDQAVTGMAVVKGFDQNIHYKAKSKDPMTMLLDHSCEEDDFSDSEFMGEFSFMDTPSILERWQKIPMSDKHALEKSTIMDSHLDKMLFHHVNGINTGARHTVIEMYWKDVKKEEYGWQKDDFGNIFFDVVEKDSKLAKKSELTDDQLDVTDGEVSGIIYSDEMRFVSFIPAETVFTDDRRDIVLDWGVVKYQERNKIDPSVAGWPYKISTWLYDKGEVISPVESAINPQRVVNRMLSVQEARFNRMTGSGPVISKEALIDTDEAEVRSAIAKGEPIVINSLKFGGVNNAVGNYGGNYAPQINRIYDTIREFSLVVDQNTGINDAMKGEAGGSDVLAGVVREQINRGSILQESFYASLDDMFGALSNHAVNVGKQIYNKTKARLIDIVGESGARTIEITDEMMTEDFRVFVERVQDKNAAIEMGNTLLLTLAGYQMIDHETASKMFGRSDADQVADAFREYQKKASIARRSAEEQRQKMLADQTQKQDALLNYQLETDSMEKQRDQMNKEADRQQKEENSIRTNQTKIALKS
jgi:hypothetical protein